MSNIIKIVVILAIIGGGAYLLLSGGKLNFSGNGFEINKSVTTTTTTTTTSSGTKTTETFTGPIKMAVEKGIPIKCTAPKNEITGVEVKAGYFKGQKYFGEVLIKGEEGNILMIDNCMYSWVKGANQGAKFCFDGGNIWDLENESSSNYTCIPAVFSDSIFTIPTNISFIDVGVDIEE